MLIIWIYEVFYANYVCFYLCTVLSDENKRFLYDVGVYDNDDDENNVCFFVLFFLIYQYISCLYLIGLRCVDCFHLLWPITAIDNRIRTSLRGYDGPYPIQSLLHMEFMIPRVFFFPCKKKICRLIILLFNMLFGGKQPKKKKEFLISLSNGWIGWPF